METVVAIAVAAAAAAAGATSGQWPFVVCLCYHNIGFFIRRRDDADDWRQANSGEQVTYCQSNVAISPSWLAEEAEKGDLLVS